MVGKTLSGAVLATFLAVCGAEAQSLAQIGGPANPPPASFKGQQFVDSRGCLFFRAGYGTGVNWVARVDRNRKPICGMPPSGGAAAQAELAAVMAPDPLAAKPQVVAQVPVPVPPQVQSQPQTRVAAVQTGQGLGLFGMSNSGAKPSPAPAPTVFSNQPKAVAQPAQVAAVPAYRTTGVATTVAGVQCYASAPVLERVKISGGMALVCTQGDGTATGWRPPIVTNAAQARVAAQTAPVMATQVQLLAPAGAQIATVQVVMPAAMAPAPQPVVRSHALPKPPKGWTYAWKDDRLNPLRGLGTAQGQAQQDQVWQRTVPMVLVTDPVPQTGLAALFGGKQAVTHTNVSTMSAPSQPGAKSAAHKAAPVVQVSATPAAPQGVGSLLVQVGSFGDPANAQRVVDRLSSLGLPVSTAQITRKGKALQVVYAGPFASPPEARSGLATVHGAGYADAFLR